MLANSSIFNLINAANVACGLLDSNYVTDPKKLHNFSSLSKGIPILIEADLRIFEFSEKDVFEVNPRELCKLIYGTEDTSYVGFRHAFSSNKFLRSFKVKKKYLNEFSKIKDQYQTCKKQIKKLRKNYQKLGAFQSRNIPHMGHELIIRKMLGSCDHVVVNPVVGPKKQGDVRLSALKKVFELLANKKYVNRISFIPITANMYYAGPREAIHHAKIRSNLGFDLFSVGRDHAGAQNLYPKMKAVETVRLFLNELDIEVFCHHGAARCDKCNQIVLRGNCDCGEEFLIDIRGTDFRQCLEMKRLFDYADIEIQEFLFECSEELFE